VIQKSDFLGCHAQVLRYCLLTWPNEKPSLWGSLGLLNPWSHDPWIWLRVNREVLTVFLGGAPWSLVEIYRRFGGTCCLHVITFSSVLNMKVAGFSESLANWYQTARRYAKWGSNMCQTTRRHSSNFQSQAWGTRMSSSGFRISSCYVFFWTLLLANWFTLLFTLKSNKRRTQNVAVEYTAVLPRIRKVPCTNFGQPSGSTEILSVSFNRSREVPG
jgi:hypothetical protein